MFSIPKMQDWDALHPLIVHLPIGILLIVPLFIFLAIVIKRYTLCFSITGLLLMIMGTLGVFIAVSTGESAVELVDRSIKEVSEIIEQHEELAEMTLNIYIILSIIYFGIVMLPKLIPMITKKIFNEKIFFISNIIFLIAYIFGILGIVNTSHLGGKLVHELGVRAMVSF